MWSLQKAREVSSKRTTIVQFKMIVLIVLTWEKFSEEYARFLLTYIDKADQMILVVLSTCPMYSIRSRDKVDKIVENFVSICCAIKIKC